MPSTSASLLDGLRRQNPKAWRDFCAIYGPEVFALARGKGLQPEDARDVVQEVFRRVLEKFPVFRRDRDGDTFQGWLCGIAKHVISDHFRRREKELGPIGGSVGQQQMARIANPSAESSTLILDGTDGEQAFCEVSRIQERAFCLLRAEFNDRYLEICRQRVQGKLPAEIATDLGISRAVVDAALYRVRKRLREYLDGIE